MINGKIYSIRTLTNENLIYIGSTKEPRLSARLSKHKSNYKAYLAGCYGYTTAFKIIELGNVYIEIVEDCDVCMYVCMYVSMTARHPTRVGEADLLV